ncbi:unnamed protein product [Meganyctiphanes norvegica]|uniref:Tetraspanin n=1 Tax=Meganyctiphanes norvegica TaxID=48144 RepID=A0AAV2Q6P8_MEGNR
MKLCISNVFNQENKKIGWLRHVLTGISVMIFLVGCFMLGYMAWVLSTSITVSKFLSGGLMFTYSVVGIGFLLFLMGLAGWVAGASEVVCIIWFFLIMLIAGLLAEISGIIALNIMDMKLEDILLYGWAEVNQGSRNIVQDRFNCCGFYGPKEFAYTDYPMDETCYTQGVENADNDSAITLHLKEVKQIGCGAPLKLWFVNNKAVWCSVLAGLGGLQLMCIVLCIHILYKLKDKKGYTRSWRKTPSKRKLHDPNSVYSL